MTHIEQERNNLNHACYLYGGAPYALRPSSKGGVDLEIRMIWRYKYAGELGDVSGCLLVTHECKHTHR